MIASGRVETARNTCAVTEEAVRQRPPRVAEFLMAQLLLND